MSTQTNSQQLSQLLLDANRHTVSVSQAAAILGISKSTASKRYRETGYLIEGVPVLRHSAKDLKRGRCFVSTTHLRHALGLPDLVVES